jgi:hypothetical protein
MTECLVMGESKSKGAVSNKKKLTPKQSYGCPISPHRLGKHNNFSQNCQISLSFCRIDIHEVLTCSQRLRALFEHNLHKSCTQVTPTIPRPTINTSMYLLKSSHRRDSILILLSSLQINISPNFTCNNI